MQRMIKTTVVALAGSALLAGAAHAQVERTTTTRTESTYTTSTPPQPVVQQVIVPAQPMPAHPRIAAIDDRIDAISARIGKLHHDDRIDGHEERNLRDRLTKVQEEEQKYITENGGHINPREQQILGDHLNRIEQDMKHWKD